ncbi:MAG: PKD domain-containing protein [Xanthomonadaceae bacterium]|nr:PKD domain-containing protein [Xanthomonadaceae bacterium]
MTIQSFHACVKEHSMLKHRSLWCSIIAVLVGTTGVASASTQGIFGHPAKLPAEHEMLAATAYSSSGHCGVERWSVKTGTDPDASLVDTSNPVPTTISHLAALTAPGSPPLDARVQPTETTTFVVDATLVEYKLEGDSDYHLVLKDAQGNTMIAEIPDPACVGAGSPLAPGIQNARSEFDARYTATTSFHTVNIPVEIKGVGFFDFLHGQTGVAPNGIELHPVTNVVFNPSGGGGDVPPVASFSDSVNGLIVAFANTSTDSDGTVVSSAWNFGDGSTSAATSPNHAYALGGTYNVSLTVTDNGGKTDTLTRSIVLSSGSSGSQLLGNTGFENGTAAPWSVSAGALCTNSSCSGEAAHAGSGFVWLDGYGSAHVDTASQAVTIPAGSASATLSFWLHVDTAETTTSHAYDTMKVQVFDSSGTLLGTVAQFSNLDAASGYQQRSVNMDAYIGKSVTLKFIGTEDSVDQTSFVLDDVDLNVK